MFARLLADRVEARGVEVRDIGRGRRGARRPRRRADHPDADRARRRMVQRDDEPHAESLLKRAAHARTDRPGSWRDADRIVKDTARKRLGRDGGALVESIRIEDGSGLSKGNRLTADFLTAWLTPSTTTSGTTSSRVSPGADWRTTAPSRAARDDAGGLRGRRQERIRVRRQHPQRLRHRAGRTAMGLSVLCNNVARDIRARRTGTDARESLADLSR